MPNVNDTLAMDEATPAAQEKAQAESAVRPKLPVSRFIYGLGMSARDATVTWVASTAAITAGLHFGGKKLPVLEKVAKFPEWVGHKIGGKMGLQNSNLKNSLAVAAGLATLVSWVAHVPGMVRGVKKVKEAEAILDSQVDQNATLSQAYRLLAEDNARLKKALEEAQPNGSMVSRLQSQPSPEAMVRGG